MKFKNESGRSMVEMLGVLAIIGVLSVGGIYGYKMAMDRIMVNEILQLVDRIPLLIAQERQNQNPDSIYNFDAFSDDEVSQEQSQEFCSSFLGEAYCQKSEFTYIGTTSSLGESRTLFKKGNLYWGLFAHNQEFPRLTLIFKKINTNVCLTVIPLLYEKFKRSYLRGAEIGDLLYLMGAHNSSYWVMDYTAAEIAQNICHDERHEASQQKIGMTFQWFAVSSEEAE